MTKCDICRILTSNEPQEVLFPTKNWRVTLAHDQAYLGRVYVTALRHVGSLSELSIAEWNELGIVVKEYERMVREAFGAAHFNWNCLLNDAFLEDEPSPHVHLKARPRYKTPPTLNGIEYPDRKFGRRHDYAEHVVGAEELNRIANKLRVS